MHLEKMNIVFEIPQFQELSSEPGKAIISPIFTFSGDMNSQLKLFLHIYPGGDTKESEGHLSIFLHSEAETQSKYSYHVEIAIRGVNGTKFRKYGFENKLPFPTGMGYRKYVSRDYLFQEAEKLMPEDKLTIWCRIEERSRLAKAGNQCKLSKLKVGQDLKFLLEDQSTSDVKLLVNNTVFHAHKAILSARSPVFTSIFKIHGFGNAKTVLLPDLDSESFPEFLRFIYTGQIEKLEQFVEQLLFIAVKYKIEDLKVLCLHEMINKLTTENAIDFLIKSQQYSATLLKNECIEFINSNSAEVIKMSEWTDLIKNHPDLITELYSKK